MQIESICVTNHICGGFEQVSMGRNAETKSLPFLSVVQSTHGSYRIALDDGPALETGEMGVFVAPRARMQHLLHIPDERDGTMSAQWIFLDVEVNRRYRLDDLFLFPTVLPEKYHQDIYVLLRRIAATERLTPAVYPTGSSHAHEKRAGGRYPPAELHRKPFFPPDIDS